MKLLVVDDEPVIRIGLRTMIDWNAHGFELIGEASDGFEALRQMRDKEVDIVITDIRMPKMDGLELLRQAKTLGYEHGTVILSCLDDFQYVKEAMKLGASDYVLKPTMEPEQLIDILQSLRDKLANERSAKQQLQQLKKRMEQTKPYQLAALVRRYLENGEGESELQSELFSEAAGCFSLYLIGSSSVVRDDELALPDVVVRLRMNEDGLLLVFLIEKGDEPVRELPERKARELTERFGEATGQKAELSVSVGPVMNCAADLSPAMRMHAYCVRQRFYASEPLTAAFGTGVATWAERTAESREPTPLPYEERNILLRTIMNGNIDGTLHWAEQIGNKLRAAQPELDKLYAFVLEMMGLAVGYARESGYAELDAYERKYVSNAAIRGCSRIAELQSWLIAAMEDMWKCRSGFALQTASNNPFVRKALKFMREHYMRNIGTADIADHVKLSRSYLSDLYSKEAGEPLTETLARIRIEEAKNKLRGGALKVYEIAEEVGFADAKTFVKTFKRIAGCTPKEYAAHLQQ